MREHEVAPFIGTHMILAGEHHEGGIGHVRDTLLDFGKECVRIPTIEQARHRHGREDLL